MGRWLMEITSLKLAYFSPTGTTRAIVHAIACGINQDTAEKIDVTRPHVREKQLRTSPSELLVVAVPVYIGRVPALLNDWLGALEADKTPVVCVVVYGNRDYEDALLELSDVVKRRGGRPIACAAFVGEHSFSSADVPIAASRPDTTDLNLAETFGRKIGERLREMSSPDQIFDVSVPGKRPYRESEDLFSIDFLSTSDECVSCGVCAESCPVGAIDAEDSSLVDTERCILCCACIKKCPENARTMKEGAVKNIAIRLRGTCKERKEPSLFF